jgi:hypothetical protein
VRTSDPTRGYIAEDRTLHNHRLWEPQILHGVISQKIELVLTTPVGSSNPSYECIWNRNRSRSLIEVDDNDDDDDNDSISTDSSFSFSRQSFADETWYTEFLNGLSPCFSRSQWPRGLRYELLAPARTLGGLGFESYSRHSCLSAFILCLCCPL